MSWFSNLFGGRSKAVQTNQVTIPSVGGFEQYNPLSKFGLDRMAGIGTGFGEDYLSKTTNPVIAQREAAFKNKTLPTISNQASSRGLGRSSLVTSQIGQAEQEKNRDIDSMVAQFYHLNEMQKKTDEQLGVGVNERLLGAQTNRASQQATLDQNRENTNAQLRVGADDASRSALMNAVQAGGQFTSAGGVQQLLAKFGLGGTPTSQPFGQSGVTGVQSPQSAILGAYNDNDLEQLIYKAQMEAQIAQGMNSKRGY